jgi:hypothetical protein
MDYEHELENEQPNSTKGQEEQGALASGARKPRHASGRSVRLRKKRDTRRPGRSKGRRKG